MVAKVAVAPVIAEKTFASDVAVTVGVPENAWVKVIVQMVSGPLLDTVKPEPAAMT
jgi:hypothetical protein